MTCYFSLYYGVTPSCLLTFVFLLANFPSLLPSAFSRLLDDNPLPLNEVSASELLVSFSHGHLSPSMPQVDRGFVTLVASDHPGIEVSTCCPSCYSFDNFIWHKTATRLCHQRFSSVSSRCLYNFVGLQPKWSLVPGRWGLRP
jgi:hypothetical protein